MLKRLYSIARDIRDQRALPPAARAEDRRDRTTGLRPDPGIIPAVVAALRWLGDAQDHSASNDGGVARNFSLIHGWATSYPETTGYILPTMLDVADEFGEEYRDRGRRMADWLVSIQLPGGGFQGGKIGQTPVVPVTFNTGQILIGLAAATRDFGDFYRPAMESAADWLASSLDADGCWRKHPTPFAGAGEKAYETHVSWGLFEAARIDGSRGWGEAAMRNVDWALTRQQPNGWFASNCLEDPIRPLTHTIGYVLRGVVEAYRFTREPRYLAAAERCATGLLGVIESDGRIPGRLNHDWRPEVSYVCLTGSVQIAHSWLLLYQETGNDSFRDAAYEANAYVRRTIQLDGPVGMRGGIKGSFPISGEYGSFQYLNWAAKFFVDANLLERNVRQADESR